MINQQHLWAVVPAAGIGARMQAPCPKQYLPLAGATVIEITLRKLLALAAVDGVWVAVAPHDVHYPRLAVSRLTEVVEGGAERAHSVFNVLQRLMERADPQDWVMVHDAARPCVQIASILKLLTAALGSPCGAILAAPVADTLKREDSGRIVETVSRQKLWQAHTPQLFRLGLLHNALGKALASGDAVTDEASAVERLGMHPVIVPDTRDNIKITQPEDLPLAEFILSRQC